MSRATTRTIGRRLDALEDIEEAKSAQPRIIRFAAREAHETLAEALERAGLAPNTPPWMPNSNRGPSVILLEPPPGTESDEEEE